MVLSLLLWYNLSMTVWTRLAAFTHLETERVDLRPVLWKDRQAFYAIISAQPPLPFIFPPCQRPEDSDALLVEAFMKSPLGVWAIADKETDEFLGVVRLEKLSERQGTAELGYFLKREVWGRGIATDVVKTLSFLVFYELGLQGLVIIAHEENQASQRVAQKAGFQLVKRFKGGDRYTKKTRSYVRYELKAGAYRYE